MTYRLAIGDRTYSSWSLRGWLLFAKFGLPVEVEHAPMRTPAFGEMLSGFGAARTVPAMAFDGRVVWDSQAMVETLAERHPDAGHWPKDPASRDCARVLVAEMHSVFGALRSACPMNLAHVYPSFEASSEVASDLGRLAELWEWARSFGEEGPWLFGSYSAVDAFFAPVATRIATYSLPMPDAHLAYVADHLADGVFRRWRARGLAEPHRQSHYDMDLPTTPWPGPTPLPAQAVGAERLNDATNQECPFSGDPIAADSLAQFGTQVIGFCNPFCRDKAVADADAWPEVMALLRA